MNENNPCLICLTRAVCRARLSEDSLQFFMWAIKNCEFYNTFFVETIKKKKIKKYGTGESKNGQK